MATHDSPKFDVPPRFTVLAVVRHTDPKHLLELIYSLIHQKYSGWECVFIDNSAGASHPGAIVKNFQQRDCRFSLHTINKLQSDLYCLDYALQFATGDFVTVIEDTGMFSSGGIYDVVSFLMHRKSAVDVVFTDADMMDDEGVIYATCFKTGCAPDALVREAHRQPLVFLSKDYLKNAGGFTGLAEKGLNGKAVNAVFIPNPLYHRRDLDSKIRKKRLELDAERKKNDSDS